MIWKRTYSNALHAFWPCCEKHERLAIRSGLWFEIRVEQRSALVTWVGVGSRTDSRVTCKPQRWLQGQIDCGRVDGM